MPSDQSVTELTRERVTRTLLNWDVGADQTHFHADVAALVESVMAALTFEPTRTELAADLQEILRSRFHLRPSWAECLTAARELLDEYRLLTVTVIDAA